MNSFKTWDDIEIAYQEWGAESTHSPPVVLHHGFVADARANWVIPGVVDALVAAGLRVIAPDARGHGSSEKPHDPARYGEQRMARDLGVLLDVIDEPEVDLVGYSMGAIVSLIYASGGERVRRLVDVRLGGQSQVNLADFRSRERARVGDIEIDAESRVVSREAVGREFQVPIIERGIG